MSHFPVRWLRAVTTTRGNSANQRVSVKREKTTLETALIEHQWINNKFFFTGNYRVYVCVHVMGQLFQRKFDNDLSVTRFRQKSHAISTF